jgi:single-stranded-DNA-specific exonuclease
MPDGLIRNWVEPEPVSVPEDFRQVIGGHALVAEVLFRRGVCDLPSARAFLDPGLYTPAPAEAMPGVSSAADRIEQAISGGQKICVWGDFDVDGQTSTTVLVSGLRALGATVSYHIPVRANESHGVNTANLQPILQSGIDLLITCDTGISSHEALSMARLNGTDVIVTDHHELPEQMPETCATVTPRLLPPDHPLAGLPGVGVAYKLIEALYTRAGRKAELDSFLDLVALGIVADVAVQTGDTRYLLQRGLPVLRTTTRLGLQTMLEIAGIQPAWLTEEHIGFILGPRLNALGRLDDANPVVELLTTNDAGRARVLATHLEGLNAHRRLLTGQVLDGALAQIAKDRTLLDLPVLVLSHPQWPAGVIGIVASELAERFNRPTILLSSPDGQPARGSARSIDGVNITAAIASQSRLLPRPRLAIAGYLSLNSLSLELVADLERLAPFGAGNPPLVLAIRNLKASSVSPIGRDGDHLQILVEDENGITRRVIWWRGAGWPMPEGPFDLACVVRASTYRGQRDIQVEWIDARPVKLETIAFHRAALAVIDQRGQPHPMPVLQQIQAGEDVLVWGEGEARQIPGACDRTQLRTADTLVLWTTPPGRAELRTALDIVQPRSVVLFAVDPRDSSPEAFLKRLAGMVKYALDHPNGPIALARLSAAAAQREAAVRKGLQWLEKRGLVQVAFLDDNLVDLAPGSGRREPQGENELLASINSIIAETAAFREFFQSADSAFLL